MFEYLIKNVQILDGSGADAFSGSVALCGGKIAAAGPALDGESACVIDGRERTLTPGFLDIHRHADAALFSPGFGRAELAQGLTTIRTASFRRPENAGLEGRSLAEIAEEQGKDPFDALFDLLADERCTVSMIDFIADESDIEDILRAPFPA